MTTSMPVLLFDGVCNVCNASVQFVLKHERAPSMQFVPLQSERGTKLIEEQGLTGDLSTVVLLVDGKAYTRSSAAVRVLKLLRGPWTLLAVLLWVVPKPLRDLGYMLFARFRYKLFGKRDACMVPTPEQRARFLT
jgi:predicted DCC family thiol-disulfide oxidoreductase YuxK